MHFIEVGMEESVGFFAKFGHSLSYYAFMMLAYEKVRRILRGMLIGVLR